MLWSVLKGAAEIGMGIYQRITEEDANKEEANQRYRNHFRMRPANPPSCPRRQRRWCPPNLSGHPF